MKGQISSGALWCCNVAAQVQYPYCYNWPGSAVLMPIILGSMIDSKKNTAGCAEVVKEHC